MRTSRTATKGEYLNTWQLVDARSESLKLMAARHLFLRVVEFASASDMKTAIEQLDDTELNGRRIRLVEDKRRNGGGRRGRSRSSSSRSRSRSNRRRSR